MTAWLAAAQLHGLLAHLAVANSRDPDLHQSTGS
jgi:hypothetical protein